MSAIIAGSAAYRAPSPGPVVTIGNFDGVHLGHRSLLAATLAKARSIGAPAVVYTFDPAPRDVLRPGNPIRRIQTLEDKAARLAEVGIDHVVVEPFSLDFGAHSAEWFAREILGARLQASALVLGWDFRFGRGREGTVEKLRDWLDIDIEQVSPFELEGAVVSSSRIRQAVLDGRIHEAGVLLGRPHEVVGEVLHGDARGRTIGFPTANVTTETALLPPDGVYAVRVQIDGQVVEGVANLGKRPTFGGETRRLEVHLFDFAGDLYGKRLHVGLVDFVRAEKAFAGLEELKHQIALDVARARELLG
ncbi:MAG: bifunctional riboflavin kinase/FAD synthetase [Proteobacteria bacterium]|nr:bifunctional riboflavin kinase/FAD synthetase [Pseudomonadota bacterium]